MIFLRVYFLKHLCQHGIDVAQCAKSISRLSYRLSVSESSEVQRQLVDLSQTWFHSTKFIIMGFAHRVGEEEGWVHVHEHRLFVA